MAKTFNSFIIVLCLISTIARFALDSYLPSLPSITRDFATKPEAIQLSISLYLFGFGCSQLAYGPLSDYYGRKRILLAGLLLFVIANMLATVCTSLLLFLCTRLLAGIGCGAAGVINRAIASDRYQGPEFAKVWSHTTTAIVITLMLAPLLGAFLQSYYSWQANLAVAAIYVTLIMFIIIKYLPETLPIQERCPPSLDRIVASYKAIISHKQFMAAVYCYTFPFAGLMVYFQLSPFIFMDMLGLSTLAYGWLSFSIAICYFLGGYFVRKLVLVIGVGKLLAIGISLLCLGGGAMLLTCLKEASTLRILLPTLIFVLGARIVIPNAVARCLEPFKAQSGCASGLIGAIQMLGSALVSTLMAQFSIDSALPLAICLFTLGLICAACFTRLFPHSIHNKR